MHRAAAAVCYCLLLSVTVRYCPLLSVTACYCLLLGVAQVLRSELQRLLLEPITWVDEIAETGRVGMCRATHPLPVHGPEFAVEASVRARGGRRFLFYSIDIAVPWRGVLYKRGGKPHWLHDCFDGVVRVYNVNHYTEEEGWGLFVAEKPREAADVPMCTPGGHSLADHPLIPLNADGSVDTNPRLRTLNATQELLLTKYGPQLARQLRAKVKELT